MHQIFHNLCSIHVHVFLLNSEHERSDLDTRPPPQDPQSLRDEILNRPSNRQPHARKQPDEGQLGTIKYYYSILYSLSFCFSTTIDLDGKWSMQWGSGGSPEPSDLPHQQPGQMESYSSSTTVIVKQRPDGVCCCTMSCKNWEKGGLCKVDANGIMLKTYTAWSYSQSYEEKRITKDSTGKEEVWQLTQPS